MSFRTLIRVALVGLLVLNLQHLRAADSLHEIPVPIDRGEAEATEARLASKSWWVQVGDSYYSPAEDSSDIARRPQELFIATGIHLPKALGERAILSEAGVHIVHLQGGRPTDAELAAMADPGCHGFDGRLMLLQPNSRIAWPSRQIPPAPTSYAFPDTAILQVLDNVSLDKYSETILRLTGTGRRHSTSPEILEARDFIQSEFESMGLETTIQPFPVAGVIGYNVIGKLVGTKYPDEYFVVGGHYDSRPELPFPSPGAEDNASGTAGVIEMARIVSRLSSQYTVYFVAFSGEEQGLIGSKYFTLQLVNEDLGSKFKGGIIMDMISYDADGDGKVLLNTDSTAPWGTELRGHLERAAMDFTSLDTIVGVYSANSDHAPLLFIGEAVLTIEDDVSNYTCYHQSCDVPANLDLDLGVEIIKMNLATLLRLANPDPHGQGVLTY